MTFWNGTDWVNDPDTKTPPPQRRPRRRLRDWFATLPIVLLLPALLGSFLVVGAATVTPVLTVTGVAVPGGTVTVVGDGFPARTWVQLHWDGSPSGMPSVRTSSQSQLTATITVPSTAALGDHTLSAMSSVKGTKGEHQPGGNTLAAKPTLLGDATLASVSIAVTGPEPSPTLPTAPTPTPTPKPMPTPTPTATPVPTATPTPAPTAAPTPGLVITAVGASAITQTVATITWTVSAPATGQVEYGTTLAYGSFSVLENSYIYPSHIQQLSGLAGGVLYHYRTRSTDAAGNSAVSADYTFTTLAGTPTPAPTPTPAATPTSAPTPTPNPTSTPSPTSPITRPFPAPVTTQTVNVPTTIDSTGATNAAAALQAFIGSVPDGSVIVFKAGGVYRMDRGISVQNRHNLVFEGNGATLRANGSGGSMWSSPFILYGSPASVSDIVIRNFTIEGNNPRTGNDIYDPATEASHGVGIFGGSRVEVYGNTIRKTWADGVYVANGDSQVWAKDLWVHDNAFAYIGRIVLTVNAGENVLFERNNADWIGGSLLDIEPDLDYQGANNVTVRNNTNGTWAMTNRGYSYWAASANVTVAPNAAVNNVTITGNVSGPPSPSGMSSSYGGLALWFGKPGYRMKNIVVTNNSTTKAGVGPVFKFDHLDGLTVTGNTQPLTSGSLTRISDSTNVVSQ